MAQVLVVSGFDWDDGNRQKCCSHGVTHAEVESLFHHELSVFPDVRHSRNETRFFAVGRTASGRHVFVAFTLRARVGHRYIRPTSARFMHSREVRHYEAEIAGRQN
jgi:uncharacterized protein